MYNQARLLVRLHLELQRTESSGQILHIGWNEGEWRHERDWLQWSGILTRKTGIALDLNQTGASQGRVDEINISGVSLKRNLFQVEYTLNNCMRYLLEEYHFSHATNETRIFQHLSNKSFFGLVTQEGERGDE